MINDLGRKIDTEAANWRTEQALLNTSIQNVQMQLLEKQGSFDTNRTSSGSSADSAAPLTHKLRFPKFDDTSDPLVWLHKEEHFFRAHETPPL
jgi:hypothetical protein